MDQKQIALLILFMTLPNLIVSQHHQNRAERNNGRLSVPYFKEPTNWKTVLIIVVSVIVFGAVIYGTTCFQICKMHFFERTEKKYTKMDSCTHV